MSPRIRVDTDFLRKKAKEIDEIADSCKNTGETIYNNTIGLNNYSGQLPIKENASLEINQANTITGLLQEDAHKLRHLADEFDRADQFHKICFGLESHTFPNGMPPGLIDEINATLHVRANSCGYFFLWFHENIIKDSYPVTDNDGACNCTQGIGHLLHKGPCKPSELAMPPWTREEAERQFRIDILNCERYIKQNVHVPLSQAQFDALVSYVFNTGNIAPDALDALNKGEYLQAAEFLSDDYYAKKEGKDVALDGLKTRRADEMNLFYNGMYGNERCDSK
jgi:GH24 family phage-related lysozyme (muramidase)